MSDDIGEEHNVQAKHPEVVEKLTKALEKLVKDGRTTPGAPQANTVDPDIMKGTKRVEPKGKGKGKAKAKANAKAK